MVTLTLCRGLLKGSPRRGVLTSCHCLFNIHFLPIIISKAISLARATTDGLLVGGGTASKETYFYNTQKKQPRHLARHH